MYKVFATPKPINFTPIISERGTNTEGSLSDMEKVVLSSYGGTRGVASLNMKKLKLWSIYEFTFQ